jgi:hypothetical protein
MIIIDNKSAIDAVKDGFPFIVIISSYKYFAFQYISNITNDWIIVSKYKEGPVVNFGPTVVVYGFKHEQDAIAFKLKFGGI